MTEDKRFGLIMGAVFLGSFAGGVICHMLTCKQCRQARGTKGVDAIAAAGAEMNGQVPSSPRVVP